MTGYSEFIYLADLLGVAVFSVTGAIAAPGKRIDILGVIVLGFVTALGGGTIRDITLDLHPVVWVGDTTYLWVAMVSAVAAFFGSRYMSSPRKALLVLDALGLSLFSVLGLQKALGAGAPTEVAVMMAVITGVRRRYDQGCADRADSPGSTAQRRAIRNLCVDGGSGLCFCL